MPLEKEADELLLLWLPFGAITRSLCNEPPPLHTVKQTGKYGFCNFSWVTVSLHIQAAEQRTD